MSDLAILRIIWDLGTRLVLYVLLWECECSSGEGPFGFFERRSIESFVGSPRVDDQCKSRGSR